MEIIALKDLKSQSFSKSSENTIETNPDINVDLAVNVDIKVNKNDNNLNTTYEESIANLDNHIELELNLPIYDKIYSQKKANKLNEFIPENYKDNKIPDQINNDTSSTINSDYSYHHDSNIKMTVVGDERVGKTSLLLAFTNNQPPSNEYYPTLFETYTSSMYISSELIKLELWDTSGQEDFDRLRPLSYLNTDIILLCFSIIDQSSLANIVNKWSPEIDLYCSNTPKVLLGLKSDLRNDRLTKEQLKSRGLSTVSNKEALKISKKLNCVLYTEISATDFDDVEVFFRNVVQNIIEYRFQNNNALIISDKLNENNLKRNENDSKKNKNSSWLPKRQSKFSLNSIISRGSSTSEEHFNEEKTTFELNNDFLLMHPSNLNKKENEDIAKNKNPYTNTNTNSNKNTNTNTNTDTDDNSTLHASVQTSEYYIKDFSIIPAEHYTKNPHCVIQ